MAIQSVNNFDSSFFSVKVKGITDNSAAEKYMTKKVISFEINEEIGKMMHGNLQMEEDFFFKTSFAMPRFNEIELQWGYKNKDQIQKDSYVKSINPKEIFTSGQLTRYAKGRIQNPMWTCGSDGKMIYSCSFLCFDNMWLSTGNKIYNNTTKGAVVLQVLQEMQITSTFIKFRREKDIVNGDTSIRRDNCSLFRFLNRLALEWQCIFRVAYDNKTKKPVALFCNYDDDKTIEGFVNTVDAATGSSILWEYKGGKRNVMSYSAQYNSSEGGTGDNVQIQIVNGQPTFFRTIASTQTVIYYKLNTSKMAAEMKGQGDTLAQSQLLTKWLQAQKWEDIKKYFDPISSTTAPQGVGLTVNIEAIGDPLCTSPARAKFGQGFPDILSSKGIIFYQTSVSHKIDQSGYKMSVSIADSFTVNGGTLIG